MSDIGLFDAVKDNDLREVQRLVKAHISESDELRLSLQYAVSESNPKIVEAIVGDSISMIELQNEDDHYFIELLVVSVLSDRDDILQTLLNQPYIYNTSLQASETLFPDLLFHANQNNSARCIKFLETNPRCMEFLDMKVTALEEDEEVEETLSFEDVVIEKLNGLSYKTAWRVKELEGVNHYSTMDKVKNPTGVIYMLEDCLKADLPVPRINGEGFVNIPVESINQNNIALLNNFKGKQFLDEVIGRGR